MRLARFPDPNVQHQLHKTGLGKCLFSQILNGTLGVLSFIPLCLSLQTLLGINWHVPLGSLVLRTAADPAKAYNSLGWTALLLGGLYLKKKIARKEEKWKHFSLLFLKVPPLPTTTTGRNVLAAYLQTP